MPDERFDGGLLRGKSARGAQGERGVGETFVQAAQAGGGVERGAGHGLGGGDGGEVGAQRVASGVRRAGMGGCGGEPEIERGVDAAVGEGGDLGRQAQDAAVEGGAGRALGDGPEAAAEREAVGDGLRGRGADLDGGAAAEAAEEDGHAPRHLVERDARVLVDGGGGVEAAGEGVPELADGFFRLPGFDVEAAHGFGLSR